MHDDKYEAEAKELDKLVAQALDKAEQAELAKLRARMDQLEARLKERRKKKQQGNSKRGM